jgi:hypothetical protein
MSAFINAWRITWLACGLALSVVWFAFLGFEVFQAIKLLL